MWSWSSSSPQSSYLKVRAGPSYAEESLVSIHVNRQTEVGVLSGTAAAPGTADAEDRPRVTVVESPLVSAKVAVRIQDFKELNPGSAAESDAPIDALSGAAAPPPDSSTKFNVSTSPYFAHRLHTADRLSIQISLTFKRAAATSDDARSTDGIIAGDELVWGNDFDRPIRDQLPYGTGVGLQIMKYAVDPSVDGDVYSDTPYLYGSALSSFNKISKETVDEDGQVVWPGIIEEDNLQDESEPEAQLEPAEDLEVPQDSVERSRFFLSEAHRQRFAFRTAPVQYSFDFYTPYLDLGAEFAINLPGFKLNVEKYGNGQPLRYTLKNKRTGDVYLVVVFELIKV